MQSTAVQGGQQLKLQQAAAAGSTSAAAATASKPEAQQPITHSKIVHHNGRTYLVQFRAQKPIEPGKQILIKTNQNNIFQRF